MNLDNFLGAFDLWRFSAGLGLFLFAMSLIEGSLTELAGRHLKRLLRVYTRTPLRGIMLGTLATSILQSSSIVTLMIISFVGAGVIEMRSALGVIFGSNLGTTFTGWIVTFIGFEFKIQSFAYPLIGIGTILALALPKGSKGKTFFSFLSAIGILFMGLDFMKEAMSGVSASLDVSTLHGFGGFAYFIFGFIFTAITQSSSATMMTTLTALNAGIINLPGAAALIIGADLGTTITGLLAGLGAKPGKKQTSLAHFLFNVGTDTLALLLLSPLLKFVIYVFGANDPLYSLVLFHSSFNFLGILLFLPFTKQFSQLLEKWVPEKNHRLTKYIHKVSHTMPEAAIDALEKDFKLALDDLLTTNLEAFTIKRSRIDFLKSYEHLKEKLSEILSYILLVNEQKVNKIDSKRLGQFLRAIDHLSRSAKSAKDIHHNMKSIENSAKHEFMAIQKDFLEGIERTYQLIDEVRGLDNSSHKFEEILELKKLNSTDHDTHQKGIYEFYKSKNLSELDIATFLNINREIYASTDALLMGLKDLILPLEKAEEI
ncbi:MAG: Na/Pi symporter [Bacteriovoracaceae bacterium]|nr:Na/Pi symporter [Bacteriovoracaceae bacterium]